jgi:alpha-galactosidase
MLFFLLFSGNFLLEAQLNETGRLRLNIGVNPEGMQWHLKQGIKLL